MKFIKISFKEILQLLINLAIFSMLLLQTLTAQSGGALQWLVIGSLHSFYSEQGGEVESARRSGPIDDGLVWPAEYGRRQVSIAQRAMWLGCTSFFDTKLQQTFSRKVVGVGPRQAAADRPNQVMEVELKLLGKYDHPSVIVDGTPATDNDYNDVLNETPDPTLLSDRMIVIIVNTSIGITVTKKIMGFSHPNHDNYFIYDYVFKNTGIIDRNGTVVQRTLNGCVFFFLYRYSFSGESYPDENGNDQSGWSPWNATWGRNCLNHVIATDPDNPGEVMHAHYAWWGPHSGRPFTNLDDDWGCPNEQEDGVMAAARYAGCVTLHADLSATDNSDDPNQPTTTAYLGSDDHTTQSYSEYDESLMNDKYEVMIAGHPVRSHSEEVELAGVAANDWGDDAGGYSQSQGFGPYTLNFGDSIHIVVAEGVAGISRAKNREVGGNWFQYYTGTGTPVLIMPDGSQTTNHTEYKKAWVQTCKDSIIQTFRNAMRMYQYLYEPASGVVINDPPVPPETFTVESGGDRIRLTWTGNAETNPHFDGYQIYRSEGSVMTPRTRYVKIFECNKENAVNTFDDTSAARQRDYYYYVQTKSDGLDNELQPGRPLLSSKFYTMTSIGAVLSRMPGDELSDIRVVPNPYILSARKYQFGDEAQYDQIAFFDIPPFCKIRIYTERGDLIWEKTHDNGSGDERWNSITTYGQIVASGVYIAYFEVTEDYTHPVTGKQFFKGQSTYRKFIVIR